MEYPHSDPASRRAGPLGPAAAVFGIFLAYSLIHAPILGPGEPHYLAKARHFHDPSWCAGDVFLESSNAHWVFYATVGALTRWLSFDTAALVGRLLALALVAWGWTELVTRLAERSWLAVFAAAGYLVLVSVGSFSGEWLLAGVEGKVFSYGFLFLAAAWRVDRRWIATAAAAGLAVSFHPVVGGWGVIAAGIAEVVARMFSVGWATPTAAVRTALLSDPMSSVAPQKESRSAGVWWAAPTLLLASLPGMIPAFASLGGKSTFAADYIQVFYRLPHHLDPTRIAAWAWWYFGALFAGWLVLLRIAGSIRGERGPRNVWFAGVVLGSILIALAGVAIGWGPRPATPEDMPLLSFRLRLMKFYPFRLADTLVPIAFCIAAVQGLDRWRRANAGRDDSEQDSSAVAIRSARGRSFAERKTIVMAVAAVAMVGAGLWIGARNRASRPIPASMMPGWRDACGWIRDHTPRDAVFLTPHETWAFKCLAERPEYVCFKDCPQDAAGILEWNRRLRGLQAWSDREWSDGRGYRPGAAERLRKSTGITHIIARSAIDQGLPPIYRNDAYAVFAIPSKESAVE